MLFRSVASNAPAGTFVYFWDVDSQGWIAGLKSIKGWGPYQAAYEVEAGEGFLLRAQGAPMTWDTVKPYTWP